MKFSGEAFDQGRYQILPRLTDVPNLIRYISTLTQLDSVPLLDMRIPPYIEI
jgi:hypothetical protein